MTNYLTVMSVDERSGLVTVCNQHGQNMQMSKELLETMYSGRHYASEVALNMTGLAALLQTIRDVVFTVNFKKQVSSEQALDTLMSSDRSCFTDDAKRA